MRYHSSFAAISPELLPFVSDGSPANAPRWMATIHNNETNSVDEVIAILIRATGCDEEEAAIETWEAHTFGKASVHFASQSECEQVASVIMSVGVYTEVTPEWRD